MPFSKCPGHFSTPHKKGAAHSAPFAVPELGSRAFLDALLKTPRSFLDATPKGAAYFAPFGVPEIGSRAFLDALFKMPRADLDALYKMPHVNIAMVNT